MFRFMLDYQRLCETKNPCQLPGECVERDGNATCICPRYYTGDFCETGQF